MYKHFLFSLAATVLIIFSESPLAQEAATAQEQMFAQAPENVVEMNRIEKALAVINSEIKSDIDQLQVLQEASKSSSRIPLPGQPERGISSEMANIADVASAQRRALERETAINSRIDDLLVRIDELSKNKRQLLDRFMELSVAPLVPVKKR